MYSMHYVKGGKCCRRLSFDDRLNAVCHLQFTRGINRAKVTAMTSLHFTSQMPVLAVGARCTFANFTAQLH